ncbi:probable glucan 1,3-beta-glucosidase A, partial [Tanacetum coccineum]
VRLLEKLKQEADRFLQKKVIHNKQLLQVKKGSSNNEYELNKLNALYQRQTQAIQMKTEVTRGSTEKLKKLLESYKIHCCICTCMERKGNLHARKGPFYIALEVEAWKMNLLGITPKIGLQAGPSITQKPTNGSVHLDLDLENDDDDMMIDAPSIRDLDQPPEDGAQLRLKSVTIGKYLAAELGGGTIIVANRTSASGWETFPVNFIQGDIIGHCISDKKLWRINETSFHIRVFNKQFLGLDSTEVNLVATSTDSEKSGIFEIIRKSDDPSRVRIKAPNGVFLQAKTENLVTADSKGDGQWGNDDPSVFEMSIAQRFQGEFQVTNGHGPLKAPQIMKDHWETFIVEKDFKFIAESGLNAVRIPVGWWTASDPSPPKPFVGGSLQYLDKAFVWAKQYNLKVILDLHAAPGSQNGFEHSATRDGFIEWGLTEENIQETVRVIEFFTAR